MVPSTPGRPDQKTGEKWFMAWQKRPYISRNPHGHHHPGHTSPVYSDLSEVVDQKTPSFKLQIPSKTGYFTHPPLWTGVSTLPTLTRVEGLRRRDTPVPRQPKPPTQAFFRAFRLFSRLKMKYHPNHFRVFSVFRGSKMKS